MKEMIEPGKAYRLINPGCVVLLSSALGGRSDLMTLAWHMPVSSQPPLVAVAVAKKHLTAEYIKESKEFVINVPGLEILPQVQYCGSISGRAEDKFAVSGLTAGESQKVKAPLVKECLGHIECTLEQSIEAGDHFIFIGKVVAAQADRAAFDQIWQSTGDKDKATFHHLGGSAFFIPGTFVEVKGKGGPKEFSVVENLLPEYK